MDTNNKTTINQQSLQTSIREVLTTFKDNIEDYEDEEGENIEETFRNHSINSLEDLNTILTLYKNSLSPENQKEQINEDIDDKLDTLWDKVEKFEKFAKDNNYTDIINNFLIINYFYTTIRNFYNEEEFNSDIKAIFQTLVKNPDKISIFNPLELKVEEDSDSETDNEEANINTESREIYFIYNEDYQKSVIRDINSIDAKQVWGSFINTLSEETNKTLDTLNSVEIKKGGFVAKFLNKLSKNSTNCMIL